MREMTPGLTALRDALAHLLAQQSSHANWDAVPDYARGLFIEEAEELLEEPDTLGFLAAVDTLVSEGFTRGSSPAVGVLLAEIQQTVAGGPVDYGTGFQDGLARAIQVLATEDAAKQQAAYRQGFRDGKEARGQ